MTSKHPEVPFRQVLAAVGQSRLMHTYEQIFAKHDITVAQALLTKADLSDRAGYLNARNTLLTLMNLRVLSIINENDVVATDEIQGARFGDNDNLSAMVANLIDADLLMILSDIKGLFTADPHIHPEAKLITRVDHIDNNIEHLAGGSATERGTGGMTTKIDAARLATFSGVTVIIADGHESDVILRLARGEVLGTLFCPTTSKMESRKRWLLSGLASRGIIAIDAGASRALKEQHRSLLPAGIKWVEGHFNRGDSVEIHNLRGERIACGISNYSSDDIARVKGCLSTQISEILGHEYGEEVVHRNNLVVL
jgi:glutamate 5-kinase